MDIAYAIENDIDLFDLDEWTHIHMFSGNKTLPYELKGVVCDFLLRETGDWHLLDYNWDNSQDVDLIKPMIDKAIDEYLNMHIYVNLEDMFPE